jgi:hypothetical protein
MPHQANSVVDAKFVVDDGNVVSDGEQYNYRGSLP